MGGLIVVLFGGNAQSPNLQASLLQVDVLPDTSAGLLAGLLAATILIALSVAVWYARSREDGAVQIPAIDVPDADVVLNIAAALDELDAAKLAGDGGTESQIRQKLADVVRAGLRVGDPDLVEALISAIEPLALDQQLAILRESDNLRAVAVIAAYALPVEEAKSLLDELRRQSLRLGAGVDLSDILALPFLAEPTIRDDADRGEPVEKLPRITTIINGTRAAHNEWWQPGGSFATKVAAVVPDFYFRQDYFKWPSGDRDDHREQAAKDLKQWVDEHLQVGGQLTLICHSHGGNVAILATRLGLKIDKLILLGVPIRTDYTPDVRNVHILHNAFVPWDAYQSAGAHHHRRGEGRTLADSDKVLNYPVIHGVARGVRGRAKSHYQLHEWNVWEKNGLVRLLS